MITDVLMDNSHAPYQSENHPQTVSSTNLSTLNAQPQNASDAQLTLDEMVDQILVKAGSQLEEGEARATVEALEKMLDPKYSMNPRTRRQCLRGLVKICGEYGTLPSSYVIPESKLQRLGYCPVSSGGYSKVWQGTYKEDNDKSRDVAIKVVRYYGSDDVQGLKKSFCREVITWKRLSHQNILELIGITMNEEECSMVSPWMGNGNIVEFVRKNHEANPLKLLEGATRGLQYLHNMDLAHGDLKGGNVLISEEGRACLADVGLTRIVGDSSAATSGTSTTGGTSTIRWSPPEILDPERYGSERSVPTKKSDIYSMAMTIYEVLTDRIPFYEHSDVTAMLQITQGELPKKPIFLITRGYTQELWDMTSSCWNMDPTKRPVVDHVLSSLVVAADLWKPKGNQLSAQSPRDDWGPTVSEGLEPENESVDDMPGSPHTSQPLGTNTPVSTPTPALSRSALPPSAVETATPTAPEKEEIDCAPYVLPRGGENGSKPDATSGKFIKKTARYFSRLVGGKAA